jgi:hypothetical protein
LLGALEIEHPPSPRSKHPGDFVRRLRKGEANVAWHIENPPQRDQIGPRCTKAMHQDDEGTVSSTFTVRTSSEPNRDARKSLFPHARAV